MIYRMEEMEESQVGSWLIQVKMVCVSGAQDAARWSRVCGPRDLPQYFKKIVTFDVSGAHLRLVA